MCSRGTRRRRGRGCGEWGVGRGGLAQWCRTALPRIVSGFARLAGCNELGRGMLSTDAGSSEGGNLRNVFADPSVGIVDCGQHRRRLRTRAEQALHSVPACRTRVAEGIGDASDPGGESRHDISRKNRSVAVELRCFRENVAPPHHLPADPRGLGDPVMNPPLPTPQVPISQASTCGGEK